MILAVTCGAVVLAAIGFLSRSWAVLVVAGVLALPLAIYLSMTPRFRGVGLLFALPLFVAAPFAKKRRLLAGALVAIFTLSFVAFELMLLGVF